MGRILCSEEYLTIKIKERKVAAPRAACLEAGSGPMICSTAMEFLSCG